MNVKVPKIHRREISRWYEFLWKCCHTVIIRCVWLILMTIALALLRLFCSRYKLPKFTPQENPLAAHPSQFVRVSLIDLQISIRKIIWSLSVSNFINLCLFQAFSSIYVHALNMWLLICPDWLCCDWSNGSLKLIETWLDQRIAFALIFYIFMIRAFILGPR